MTTDTQHRMPVKTREMHNHHFDSTIWNDLVFRDDDIVISTYAKSGTTWMQQIVSQLIFEGAEALPVAEMSPWLDLRVPPKQVKLPEVEAQTHRRFLKTHLPVDALRMSSKAKYIYIGRDGRDVMWSMHNHHSTANQAWYDALNKTPGLVGPEIGPPYEDPVEYFRHWLENGGAPFWPFWENVRSWWEIRDLPNVLMVHFADLKRDFEGELERIAAFLEIPIPEDSRARIIEHCSFDYMKRNAAASVPLGGAFWDGGAQSFIHKGTNGRWRDRLPSDISDAYEQRAEEELGKDAAAWLKEGRQVR
ncbi:MAG: sulfotransferase domain-containing protein [Limimaricola soesokkakensis]|uniref:sulfotransferase domain-containing protein n=1 Tax=Limimaricola soesokkakensis TaxID=1343159 RepID=UPI004057DFC2